MAGKLAGMAALVAILAVGMAVKGGSGALVKYEFEVTHGFLAPDCAKKAIYLVNGVYPGPDINVTVGDTVRITVHNELYSEAVSIHWHGIKQTRTPYMDGVPFLTQCPTITGSSFTYEFIADQAGTYWWHSHYSLQKANGLYGLIVVRTKTPENTLLGYDKELKPMLLNDWWHASPQVQEIGLLQKLPNAVIWVSDPQSLLINGRGVFNCSAAATTDCLPCNSSSPDCGYSVFEVEQGKRYRVRLVNVGSLSYLSYNIQGHNVTVVQADGSYTDPVKLQHLNINGGQSFSVVFTANQPIGNYWITTHVRHRANTNGPTGAAILRYKGAAVANPTTAIPSVFPAWNDTVYSVTQERQIVTRAGYTEVVPAATREILLVATQNRLTDGSLVWALNNNTYAVAGTPTLLEQYYGFKPISDDKSNDKPKITWNYTNPLETENISKYANKKSVIYRTELNSVVQIVIQNTIALNNVSEQHPWHLHGHDFWVLGWGNGSYSSTLSPKTFNLKNPLKRNTVTLYPKTWVAIRFKADNAGVWNLHCHIVFHHALGMQLAIAVGLDKLPPLPRNFPTCGNITSDVIRSFTLRGSAKGHHATGIGHHKP